LRVSEKYGEKDQNKHYYIRRKKFEEKKKKKLYIDNIQESDMEVGYHLLPGTDTEVNPFCVQTETFC
jgi:hypothetical protein